MDNVFSPNWKRDRDRGSNPTLPPHRYIMLLAIVYHAIDDITELLNLNIIETKRKNMKAHDIVDSIRRSNKTRYRDLKKKKKKKKTTHTHTTLDLANLSLKIHASNMRLR